MKFQFQERVKVLNGFFRDQECKVYATTKILWFERLYRLNNIIIPDFIWVKESELESLDFPHKQFNETLDKIINDNS